MPQGYAQLVERLVPNEHGPIIPRLSIRRRARGRNEINIALLHDSVIRLRVLCCAVTLAKCERDRVHAVARSSRRRSVIKDMSKMRATARTRDFPAEDR
jgi:hypothetical protein